MNNYPTKPKPPSGRFEVDGCWYDSEEEANHAVERNKKEALLLYSILLLLVIAL